MTADGHASDGDLLRATRSGDGAAFATFYRRYLSRVVAFLLRETGDREASAELASGPGVLALVDELPPRQRAAITARIVQEREYPEIAAQLECSEMVVRQQVSRRTDPAPRSTTGGSPMSVFFAVGHREGARPSPGSGGRELTYVARSTGTRP